jgi:hypothetical protein
MSKQRKRSSLRRERTTFEWVVLVVSSAATLAIAVALLVFSVTAGSGPPELRATIEKPSAPTVTVIVENKGGTTAEEVIVEVVRGRETQDVEFKTIPKEDTEEAAVRLGGRGTATAHVRAYKEP